MCFLKKYAGKSSRKDTMPTITLQLDPETQARLSSFATARRRSADAILHEALNQYLNREENQGAKNYPRRTPVGGIITPF